MSRLSIGIAGAGIGGLAVAAALAQAGHQVLVYDRFDAPRPVGSGLVIQPVGQAVLARIGALETADRLGRRVTHMLGHAAGVRLPVLDVTYGPGPDRFGLALHRAALFHAVHEAASAAGAEIIAAHEVTGVSEAPRRRLRFSDGRESPAFDLIIDASGAGSCLSPLKARALPFGAIWGVVDWPEAAPLPEHRLSQRYAAARRMVGVLPIGCLPGGAARKAALFWSLTREELGAWQDAAIGAWREEAIRLWPEAAPYVEAVRSHAGMTPAFYSHGSLRNPAREALVHIGDAAHRASPQLGQGANMALLDGWALAQALQTTTDVQAALARYVRARHLHLWAYQLMSAVFTPLYQSDSRALPLLRDRLLAPLSRIPPAPALLSKLVCGDLLAPIGAGLPGLEAPLHARPERAIS